METDTTHVRNTLQALANLSADLYQLASDIRENPISKKVISILEIRKYQTGRTIEGYVDVELIDGRSITWWIDFQWEEKWEINARILLNDAEGQRTIHEFDKREITTIDQFIQEIERIGFDLINFDAIKLLREI